MDFNPKAKLFQDFHHHQKSIHSFQIQIGNLADFNNVNKEFLPKRSPKKIPLKKILPKNPSKNSYKRNLRKIQKIPPKLPKNTKKNQFPTSHLEAENPFGLVTNLK